MLKIVATIVVLICVTSVVSSQSRTRTERWLNGTWEGTGYQIDNNETWAMKLTVRGKRYKIEYPSLKCGGRWIPLSIDRGRARFTEKIFADDIVAAIREGTMLRIRAGSQPHRFIGIWAVVVEGRVFVRSWSLEARSWYRTFLEDSRGTINVEGRELTVRAVRTRSERLKDAIDQAYLEKYKTPGSIKYARDL